MCDILAVLEGQQILEAKRAVFKKNIFLGSSLMLDVVFNLSALNYP